MYTLVLCFLMAMMGWSVFSWWVFTSQVTKKLSWTTWLSLALGIKCVHTSTCSMKTWQYKHRYICRRVYVCVTACDVVSSRCQRGPSEYTETPGMWNTQSHWCGSASVKCLVFYFIFASFIFLLNSCALFSLLMLLMYASVLFWSYTSDRNYKLQLTSQLLFSSTSLIEALDVKPYLTLRLCLLLSTISSHHALEHVSLCSHHS